MAAEAIGTVAVDERDRLDLARRGDAAARERLYVEHAAGLLRRARMLVRDSTEAEDLVQDAFAVAFGSLARFRGEASFRAYLHGIALNLARHRWRRAARARAAFSVLRWFSGRSARDEPSASDRIDAGRAADAVADAIEALRPKAREAFVLLLVERLPGEEAARIAGVDAAVLRVRATRARHAVLAAVRRRFGEEI